MTVRVPQGRRGRDRPATASVTLVAGALVDDFVDLGWAIDSVLDAFPDEIEATFERGFYISNRGVDGIVDGFEQLCDLVDAEERVGVEDERNDDFAGRERAALEGGVAHVREHVPEVGTPDAGTTVPGLDGGFATLWTGSLFPSLLTVPVDAEMERLWSQH